MRRAPIVLVGTAAGLAGVLLFRPHSPGLTLGTIPSASGTTASRGASSNPTGTGSATSGTSGSSSTGTSGSSSTASNTGSSSPASTSTAGSATTATYTGTQVTYNYGVLSVRVTVSGHTIKDVGIASITEGGNFRSESIDQQAIPVLERETIDAQSANIQGVSGASYTSAGFVQSLQSALSKAGL